MKQWQVISPVDGKVFIERTYADAAMIETALANAKAAQPSWAKVTLDKKADIMHAFMAYFKANQDDIANEITWQMGRPIQYAPGEVNGLIERAEYMVNIAEAALADIQPGKIPHIDRFIRREPLGVVCVVAPWNYPYLTAVNTIVPALMAGNTVILKHASQTPLCAERFAKAFEAAGLPEGVFQYLHMTHEETEKCIQDERVNFVAFTGSVGGGHRVKSALSHRFIGCGLELGGKDPAYVRADADLALSVPNLVDGVYFNSGQSCCGIERIYVDESVYDEFVERFVALTKQYRLGNPLEPDTTLGPLVKASATTLVRDQIAQAQQLGANALIDESEFAQSAIDSPYLAPQVMIDVNHNMALMTEENFGPVVGIMPVSSDEQAVALMNDSQYGLTASVWTQNESDALRIGAQVQTGTWFMNRCDYLDPALVWTGVKNTGHGGTLSILGYEQLTQAKSYHLRVELT